ncbi:MAG: BrnA antitoxin family protein [Spirochaetes bacterium]|uniref:BrnA antitoxin family protein n=1 Tax=Candidatus Aphodenecus pullistercoris TaxID=2840669 RepID=A0A9D9E935_9SPIR|nr:BrnA antitoxin family protein [Candidatus Aphodenecus pullistercoris]
MKTGASKFTPERIEELREKIDLSDIPEITDFSKGHFRNWKPVKKPVTVRIDSDILYWLKGSDAKGYQKRLNDTLRWAMTHDCPL